MKYEIIEKDWYKRRVPSTAPKAVSVAFDNLQQQANHMCKMHVTFDNGEIKQLISRVIYNKLNNTWSVDGMEVAVRIIEF